MFLYNLVIVKETYLLMLLHCFKLLIVSNIYSMMYKEKCLPQNPIDKPLAHRSLPAPSFTKNTFHSV